MTVSSRLAAGIAAAVLAATACSDQNGDEAGADEPGGARATAQETVTGPGWAPRSAAPFERTEIAAGAIGGQIWVVGGLTADGRVAADVAGYDPAADTWRASAPMPEPLHHPAAAGDGSRLWVVGGYPGRALQDPTAAVRVMDPATGTWTDGPALPSPRAAGALAWDGRRLVYGGGVGPDGPAADVFALEGGTWRRIGQLSQAREHLAAAADGKGTTWFLGGRNGGLGGNLADVDVVTGTSVRRAGALPTARGGVAGFHSPEVGACAVGGEESAGTFDEVECLGADGVTTALPPMRSGRHGLGAVVVDGVAYTLLGGDSPGLFVSDTVEALPL